MPATTHPRPPVRPVQRTSTQRVSPQAAPSRARTALAASAGYLVAAILSTAFMARILKLWHADLAVPMDNSWDALLTQMWVKGVFEHGWYLQNGSLGAPAGMQMYDFPMADALHFVLIRLLCLATPNYAVAFNVYYLLCFPLITLSTLFALRRFAVSYPSALAASLLYTFLPYHFLRGQQHLFLAAYYVVPLSTMVVLWLCLGRLGAPRQTGVEIERAETRRWAGSLAIAALQSSAGVYYAFFACFLLLVAGASAALDTRRWRPMAAACLLVAVTAAGVLVNTAPSLIYWRANGPNRSVAHRDPQDAEFNGLKIGQMLLPDAHHRLGRLAELRRQYERWPLAGGENRGATLGVIGDLGFLLLLGLLLRRRGVNERSNVLGALSILNISAVLLATVGGFGSLVSFLISPQIRCYNRISVFIALFSLFAAAIAFDRLARWRANAGGRQWPVRALLAAVVAAGVIDEAGRDRVPNYAALKADFHDDAEFVGRVEAAVPAGSMVLQLPYFPFPESPRLVDLGEYELFRPYLHSRSLRWSYGAMKGRDEDRWQRETCQRPAEEFVQAVADRGFAGIYIDRRGYADRAAALEVELTKLLGKTPLVSRNERMSFFAMPATEPQRFSTGETQGAKPQAPVQKVRR